MTAAPDVLASEFYPLAVGAIEPLTDEAVAVTFEVPPHLADTFAYLPGQHVTIRAFIDGTDVRRSYSICADANGGKLRVGIKRLAGGAFSTWATSHLEPGDTLDVMPPVGDFTRRPDPTAANRYVAVAAGSGITPVLSLVATILGTEADSCFTLIYGNRTTASIMFLEELGGLKDRYPDRFQLINVLSREPQIVPLFDGRIDAPKLNALLDTLVDTTTIDAWYLCGPHGLVTTARQVLGERGVPENTIHDELFYSGDIPDLPPVDDGDTEGFAEVTFTLDGRQSRVMVDPGGRPILDRALQVRRELPFACRGGVCATCKAMLLEGSVAMDHNYALVPAEVDRGLVLTCQSHPTSERVVLDYDV